MKPHLRPRLKAVASALAAVVALVASSPAGAQTPPPAEPQTVAPSMAAAPTTRVLAIGRLTKPLSPGDMQTVMPKEVRDTVNLYLAGKIADWYIAKDAPGVVFILDVQSTDAARALTADLPLVKAGLMQFQFIPLGPLSPLRLLTR